MEMPILKGGGGDLEKKMKFLVMPPHLLYIREVPHQLFRFIYVLMHPHFLYKKGMSIC